jgi:gamma-glutamylcyclotransferase (GGCT)/AIG2-like uncharacterized protein YtfP
MSLWSALPTRLDSLSVRGGAGMRLATYGTLAPGRENHGQLTDLRGRWVVGHVRGSLVDSGWGAELGFPALVLDPDGASIEVFMFESEALASRSLAAVGCVRGTGLSSRQRRCLDSRRRFVRLDLRRSGPDRPVIVSTVSARR